MSSQSQRGVNNFSEDFSNKYKKRAKEVEQYQQSLQSDQLDNMNKNYNRKMQAGLKSIKKTN